MNNYVMSSELTHHGVLGMKWGVRRYQPYGSGGYNPKNKGEFRPDKKESSGEKTTSEKAKVISSGSVFEERNKKQDELYKQFTKDVSKFDDIKPKDDEWFDPETGKITKKSVNYLNKLDPIEEEYRKKDTEIWNEYLDKYNESVKDFVTSEEVKPRMDKIMEARKEIDKVASETIYDLDDTDPNYYDNFLAASKEYESKTKKLEKTIRSEKDSILNEYCTNDSEKEQMSWAINSAVFRYDDWVKEMEHSDTKERTMYTITNPNELYHHGVLGMKWGIRRYQPYGTAYDAEHKGKFVGERKTKKTRSDRDPQANRSSTNARKGAYKLNAKSVEKIKKRSSANKDEITIDVTGAKTKDEIHDRVQKSVNTPDYYGRNLDALNDVLTEQGVKKVNIKGADKTEGEAKEYGGKLQKLADDINKDSNSEYTIDKVSDDNSSKETNKIAKEFVDLCGKDNTPYEDIEKFIEKHEDNYDVMDNGDHVIVADKNSGAYTIINYSNKKRTEKYKEDVKADKQKLEESKKQPDKKVNYNPKTEEEYLQSVFNLYDNEMKKRNVLHDTDLSDEDVGEIEELVRQIQKPTKSKKVKHTDVRDLTQYAIANDELYHHGVLGMKWGVRKR